MVIPLLTSKVAPDVVEPVLDLPCNRYIIRIWISDVIVNIIVFENFYLKFKINFKCHQ